MAETAAQQKGKVESKGEGGANGPAGLADRHNDDEEHNHSDNDDDGPQAAVLSHQESGMFSFGTVQHSNLV